MLPFECAPQPSRQRHVHQCCGRGVIRRARGHRSEAVRVRKHRGHGELQCSVLRGRRGRRGCCGWERDHLCVRQGRQRGGQRDDQRGRLHVLDAVWRRLHGYHVSHSLELYRCRGGRRRRDQWDRLRRGKRWGGGRGLVQQRGKTHYQRCHGKHRRGWRRGLQPPAAAPPWTTGAAPAARAWCWSGT